MEMAAPPLPEFKKKKSSSIKQHSLEKNVVKFHKNNIFDGKMNRACTGVATLKFVAKEDKKLPIYIQ